MMCECKARLLAAGGVFVIVLSSVHCPSHLEYERGEKSMRIVQAACVEQELGALEDGWGTELLVVRDPDRGRLVVSKGTNRKLDKEVDAYWAESECGEAFPAGNDDIVCVNGRVRRWATLTPRDMRDVLKLPVECSEFYPSDYGM